MSIWFNLKSVSAASILLLQGTGVSSLMTPASHKNSLDPKNNSLFRDALIYLLNNA